MLGDSPATLRLWQTLDHIACVFWDATRRGLKLPADCLNDIWRIATAISPVDWPLARYVRWTVSDLLRSLHQVVSALPIELTARIAPRELGEWLQPYLRRNQAAVGGALVLFLGVPEEEVAGQDFTHHQVLQDYDIPLGNGNNMFISVSSPGDVVSAPGGFRSVMISTHCELKEWEGLSEAEYVARKQRLTNLLLDYSRRVYPRLGENAVVCELATPRTFERFTSRPRGAVGGFRQRLSNTNQWAVPHASGLPGFWLVGDTTWPGLGTVACVHGSRIVAEGILARRTRSTMRPRTLKEHEHGADQPAGKSTALR